MGTFVWGTMEREEKRFVDESLKTKRGGGRMIVGIGEMNVDIL